MKPLIWLGSSRRDVKAFPESARRMAGFQLWRVQAGLQPNDFKPMPGVGLGVMEMRLHTGEEHRIVYLARFTEGVYVLHAFEKQTSRTPRRDLDLARTRFQQLIRERRKLKGRIPS